MLSLERSQRWLLTTLALLFCLWLLRSFLVPFTWAFLVAAASWPHYRRFAARLSRRVGLSVTALLFTAFVTLLVLGPLGFAFFAIAGQAQIWAHAIGVADKQGLAAPEWLLAVPLAGSWLVDQWNVVLGTPGGVTHWLNGADSGSLLEWAGSAGGFVVRHATIIVFTVLALFFLYRGGEPLAGQITQFIHDKLGARGDAYFRQAIQAVRATFVGMIVVSLIDGALCGVAYAIAGLPAPHVWGAITGLLAMIPFLAYFAVAAAALVLLAKGAGHAAAMIFGWGVIVVFVADKFIRTMLIGDTIRLGFIWVLVGGLAGLETFGLLGLVIGPVILAMTGALLRDAIGAEN
jgi:predicted PurR-regulated permease PerM